MGAAANPRFHDAVSALAYALAQPHAPVTGTELQPPYNDLTRFILRQHADLPDYLRLPLKAATLGFDLCSCPTTAALFHTRPLPRRQRQIGAWKKSRLSFRRDLMRYFESLAVFALYSRGEAAVSQTPENPSADQLLSQPPHELKCEIAVVGSGPGGAITACLLAESGRNVLLIEEGPYLPLESCPAFSQQEMLQKYRNGGQTVAFGSNKISYVEGRCVGGGSEINSGLYHRTPPEILETWRRQFQVEALTEKDLDPHFEACEKDLSVSLLRGPAPAASLKLHEGARRLGWHSLEIPRWVRPVPGHPSLERRQSMTRTFIPRLLQAGARVLPLTRVTRISAEGPGIWCLEAAHAGTGRMRIQAETLFVCAGAVQTAALLRRSGIRKNIGNSLRMHPTIKLIAKFAEPVNHAGMGVPAHQVKEFAPRLSFGCSVSTPAYLALGLLDQVEAIKDLPAQWNHLAAYYAMITGGGQGTVRALARHADPVVRYQLTETDRRDLADGVRKLGEMLFEAGAVAAYPGLPGAPTLRSVDDLRKLPDSLHPQANLMTIHLFSSCPMGEDQSRCVTNSFGQVHGFKNLFIADASLLCGAPGVNPQGSIMALARRNALHFLNR